MTKPATTTTGTAPTQAANIKVTVYQTKYETPFEGYVLYAVDHKDVPLLRSMDGCKVCISEDNGRAVVSIRLGSSADRATVSEGFDKASRSADLLNLKSGVTKTEQSGKPAYGFVAPQAFGEFKQAYIQVQARRSKEVDTLLRMEKQIEYQRDKVKALNAKMEALRAKAKELMRDDDMRRFDSCMNYLHNAVKSA